MPHLPDTCACLASTLATCRYARLTLYFDSPNRRRAGCPVAAAASTATSHGSTSWLTPMARHHGSTRWLNNNGATLARNDTVRTAPWNITMKHQRWNSRKEQHNQSPYQPPPCRVVFKTIPGMLTIVNHYYFYYYYLLLSLLLFLLLKRQTILPEKVMKSFRLSSQRIVCIIM